MDTRTAVSEFILSRTSANLSTETIRWYRGILNAFTEFYPKLPRKERDIELFLSACTAGDERQHGYFRALRAFYNYLETRHHKKNLVRFIGEPQTDKKLPRPLSPEKLNQLLCFPHPRRTKAVLFFLANTGVRLSELVTLQPEDFDETLWGYSARVTGKTGTRVIPVSHSVYTMVIGEIPFKMTTGRMSHIVTAAFRDAHVPGSAINLRHTFGTLWEGSEDVLQMIMGHSKYSTTQIYRHLRIKVLSEQHAKYNPLKLVLPMTQNML